MVARADRISLYTIQSIAWWQKLKHQGKIRADGRYVQHRLRPCYRFMREEMSKHLPGCTGKYYPIWCYLSVYDAMEHVKQDVSTNERKNFVLIKLRVPKHKALISSARAWGMACGTLPICLNREEAESDFPSWLWCNDYEERVAFMPGGFYGYSLQLQQRIASTWTRAFDLHLLNHNEMHQARHRLQATIEEVALDQVREVIACSRLQTRKMTHPFYRKKLLQ